MSLGPVDAAAERLGRGILAGLAGTAAMTLSTTAEMKIRGRAASRTPLEVAEKVLGVESRADGRRLATAAHVLTGVANAGLVALAGRASAPALFTSAMLPEMILVPSLTAVPPPWRWSANELALSVGHHAVYALAAHRAYRALESARPR